MGPMSIAPLDIEPVSSPIHVVTEYSGSVKELIVGWKYRGRTQTTKVLAARVVDFLRDQGLVNAFDVVTWAPTSARRRRGRGYDQSELLATTIARTLHRPCRHLLRRDDSPPQTGRSRLDRMSDAPHFIARPVRRLPRILVIDDVVTTGSSLRSAELALRRQGARDVVLCAFARARDRGSHCGERDTPVNSRTCSIASLGS